MPPPSNDPSLNLEIQSHPFFVIRIEVEQGVPQWALERLDSGGFLSITRTSQEISIVGGSYPGIPDALTGLLTWTCIKILGPLGHELTGIMVDFATPLKKALVPIFALSTWDTDYVLVPTEKLSVAISALKADGWAFVE